MPSESRRFLGGPSGDRKRRLLSAPSSSAGEYDAGDAAAFPGLASPGVSPPSMTSPPSPSDSRSKTAPWSALARLLACNVI